MELVMGENGSMVFDDRDKSEGANVGTMPVLS